MILFCPKQKLQDRAGRLIPNQGLPGGYRRQ
mgnify:CR=1 FL=1|jgi:hypothetical protein